MKCVEYQAKTYKLLNIFESMNYNTAYDENKEKAEESENVK